MGRRPDFIVIGAMKAATSTLHEQLARRPGLFLSDPKEPNFFSDDACWERGLDWYEGLFAGASPEQRCGESSTHYTKLPTHPETVKRMGEVLPAVRLVYVMRHPVERIVSQYVHEWSQREVDGSIDRAVSRHRRYVAYSSYARQLEPFLERYGSGSILPVAYERLVAEPDATFAEVCRFVGDPSAETPRWSEDVGRENVSSERLRRDPMRERILANPVARAVKDLLPEGLRERAKAPWRMRARPELSAAQRARIEAKLDADLARLGEWLGRPLSCARWEEAALAGPFAWARPIGAGG